jgi:ABC-type phosphate transport system substrate-binding protein
MNRSVKLLLAALLVLAAAPAVAEPLAIIVDRDNPKTDLSAEELKSIYLGKRTEWSDGARAVPIDQDPSAATRAAFMGGVVGMNQAQFAQHWVDQQVRGAGSAPKVASSPASAMKLVAKVRGAVAFVPASMVDASVKVVSLNGKKAGDPGYALP